MSHPVINLSGVEKVYEAGTARETKALQGIDLSIAKGEIVIIFGPSGSGKSTLLNILAGLDRPTDGSIIIDGEDLMDMDEEEAVAYHQTKIGMVFQAYELIPTLTVLQNITMPARIYGSNATEYRERGLELLEQFELGELSHRLPPQISGGQQQRVGIMRALMNQPELIVADEPTGNLDSKNARKIMDLLLQLNQKTDTTMIIVSHDPELFSIANRVVYLKDGIVEKEESPDGSPIPKIKARIKAVPKSIGKFSTFADLVANRDKLTPVQQGIVAVLMVILRREQQDSLSSTAVTRLVENIELRVSGKISQSDLQQSLDLPLKKGGVGLYRQTAEHVASNIEAVLLMNNHDS